MSDVLLSVEEVKMPVVATIQMVSTDDIADNMRVAQNLMIRAAEDQGATMLVLPENFLAMNDISQDLLSKQVPFYLDKIQALAKQLGVSIVAGSMPVADREATLNREGDSVDKGRYRSASYMVSSAGEVIARYDKIHLFDVDVDDTQGAYRESDTYAPGDAVKVVDVGRCKVGLSVCYDLRFPMLFQRLVDLGAELIVLPAAFTKTTGRAHWEMLLRARAIETQCFVAAANQGGIHSDKRETWGHSMIVDPWGQIIAQCETGESICSAQLDLDQLKEIRFAMPVQAHKLSKYPE